MDQTLHHLCDFGAFRLDPLKRLLLRNGAAVSITPKAFDLLLALVESNGEVVSKDDLMKRIWPDSFVEDGNLTYNISVLRRALGEKANEHHYIVTVPGRGYRFVARLSEVRDADREPGEDQNGSSAILEDTFKSGSNGAGSARNTEKAFPAAGEEVSVKVVEIKPFRMRRSAILIALLIALPSIGYFLSKFIMRNASYPFRSMRMTRLTTNGRVADAVISPDGKYVAYVLGEAGSQSVCVTQVGTASTAPILPPADVKYYGLTFTQDSNHIFYVRDEHNSAMASLYQVPLLGRSHCSRLHFMDRTKR